MVYKCVYNGKSHEKMDDDWGYPHVYETPQSEERHQDPGRCKAMLGTVPRPSSESSASDFSAQHRNKNHGHQKTGKDAQYVPDSLHSDHNILIILHHLVVHRVNFFLATGGVGVHTAQLKLAPNRYLFA